MKRFILPIVIAAAAILGVSAFAFAATGGLGSNSLASNNSSNSGTTTTQSTPKCLPPQAKGNPVSRGADKACLKGRGHKIEARIGKLMRRSVQDQFTVKGKNNTWVTVNIDRGTVSSISSTSITVSIPDGKTVTAPITSTTKFVGIKEASIVSGDRVIVVEKNNSAVLIGTMKPKPQTGSSSSNGQGSTSGANLNSVSA
jgi:hypothetical protein